MGNTSNEKEVKGSQYWMQQVVNCQPNKIKLDQAIGLGDITWLSPLKQDECKEYKLRQDKMLEQLDIPISFYKFWPYNQPCWDAIGVAGETIILVEAKAHIYEFGKKTRATDVESKQLIYKTMTEVFEQHYSGGTVDAWLDGYYQMGNRLTFLHKMNDFLIPKGRQVKLVLLNFANDYTNRCTPLSAWEKKFSEVFTLMTGSPEVPDNVIMIHLDVEQLDTE